MQIWAPAGWMHQQNPGSIVGVHKLWTKDVVSGYYILLQAPILHVQYFWNDKIRIPSQTQVQQSKSTHTFPNSGGVPKMCAHMFPTKTFYLVYWVTQWSQPYAITTKLHTDNLILWPWVGLLILSNYTMLTIHQSMITLNPPPSIM